LDHVNSRPDEKQGTEDQQEQWNGKEEKIQLPGTPLPLRFRMLVHPEDSIGNSADALSHLTSLRPARHISVSHCAIGDFSCVPPQKAGWALGSRSEGQLLVLDSRPWPMPVFERSS